MDDRYYPALYVLERDITKSIFGGRKQGDSHRTHKYSTNADSS